MGFAQSNEIDKSHRDTYESHLQMDADSWTHNVIMEAYAPNSNSEFLQAHTDNMNRSTMQMQAELNNALMMSPYNGVQRKK